VEAGFAEFGPLIDFRDWLASIRNDPKRRLARRRNGRMTVTRQGVFVPGPFTLSTRREILDRLLKLETVVGREVISPDEIAYIKAIWAQDSAQAATWAAERIVA
jgi:DNA sulfur modification protein DndC